MQEYLKGKPSTGGILGTYYRRSISTASSPTIYATPKSAIVCLLQNGRKYAV
jgi:hypothetical protein